MAAGSLKKLSPFNVTALALGLAFLYLPIVILVIYSFNASRLVTVWGGWSLRWYTEFFHDQAMLAAARMSFTVASLSATLAKMEPALLEAAADLGSSPLEAFWLVTFPLSLPGIGAGVLLCFIPIVGEFVIPDLLPGSNSMMIGQTLWLEFFTNKDWPVASAVALVLLALLLVPLLIYDRLQRRQLEDAR